MMSDPIYRIKNLTQAYNGRIVLKIDSLEIYAGEILALVGPSGAGKSTLLRLLNFLEQPTAGKVFFAGGAALNGSAPSLEARRKVTTVFQQPAAVG